MEFVGKKKIEKKTEYQPDRTHVIRVTSAVAGSTIIANVAMFSANGHAERDDPAVSSSGDLAPLAVRHRLFRFDSNGSNRASGTTVREDHSSAHQLQHDEVRAAARLRCIII